MEELKVRKKLLFMMLSASFIALVLSGCFLLPAPTVHFTAPTTANVSAYPVNQPITFKWAGSSSDLRYTLTVTRANSTPLTLLSNSALTEFSTSLTQPGTYTAKVVGKDKTTGKEGIATTKFSVTSLKILTTTSLYGKNTVNVKWESLDSKSYTYLYSIDGKTWTATTATSATLTKLSDGSYTFQVKIKSSLVPPAVYNFQVLTAGPSLSVSVESRTMGDFYGMGSHPEGRYALLGWTSNQGKLLSQILVKFYIYVKDPTTGLLVRRRLAINPTTNTWEMLPATATFSQQPFYMIDATKYSEMIVSASGPAYVGGVGDNPSNWVTVYDMSGNKLNIPAFPLGSTFAIIWFPANSLGNMGNNAWALFRLSERYGNTNAPKMYVQYNKYSVATGSNFTANVMVPNVTAYASGSHEIINDPIDHTDITSNNGLMYTQFSLAIAPGLTVDSVTFPNMEAGKANLHSYTYDATNGILTVYRGFVDPVGTATAATSATDIAVSVTCTVPATYSIKNLAYVGLIYEGSFTDEGYANLNPVFRDNSNKIIDGIITYPSIYGLTVTNGQSM